MAASNKIMTPVFRVSFPQVFTPKAVVVNGVEQGKKKYSLVALFTMAKINANPEDKKLWEAMIAAAKAAAAEKWPKGNPPNMQNPFRNGEEKEFQGYGAGVKFMTLTTTTRPGLVDQAMTKIIAPEDFYAGCYARATINPYAWNFMGKNGVSFGLQNIQKVADGEPFSGRTNAEDDFNAVDAAEAAAGSTTDTESLFG